MLKVCVSPAPVVEQRDVGNVAGIVTSASARDSSLSVFLGDGRGGFFEQVAQDAAGNEQPLSAGNLPTGLAVFDVNGDGRLDLLVGNEFGDILTLLGNGDGTFQPYQRAGRNIALAVVDLNGDGRDDFIFANESRDRVSVQYSQPGQTFARERGDGLLAPGAVTSADLNRDGLPDLLIANSGANSMLVYLGAQDGQLGPAHTFFVGTNPVGITVKNLNGDQLPDLVVANEGSNDVSILLGQGQGNSWTLTPGPRLKAGLGPVSTTVQDVTGDGRPDILVTNRDGNNVFLLPGVGGGFFNDQTPTPFTTGAAPQQAFVGNFDARPGLDLVTINAGSNDLTFFSGFGPGRLIASGGETPLAALAGDFNRDGFDDLLVANNGDGQVALLLGEADGLALAQTFAHPDVPHPTALALSDEGDRLEVYVAEEGQESALLLTSFGIAVPVEVSGPLPPLPDVFVVNGPGLPTGIDILDRVVVPDSPREGAEAAGFTLAAAEPASLRPVAGVAGEELAAARDAGFLLGGGGEEADMDATTTVFSVGEDPSDGGSASPLTRFMLGLDEAFRSRPDTAEQDAGQEGLSPQAVDQVFRQWLRDLRPQEILDGVIEALRETVRRATIPGRGQAPARPPADPGWLPPVEPAANPSEPREEKDEPPEEEMGLSGPFCSTPPLSESARENTGAWAGPWGAAFLLAGVIGLREGATRRRSLRPTLTGPGTVDLPPDPPLIPCRSSSGRLSMPS